MESNLSIQEFLSFVVFFYIASSDSNGPVSTAGAHSRASDGRPPPPSPFDAANDDGSVGSLRRRTKATVPSDDDDVDGRDDF